VANFEYIDKVEAVAEEEPQKENMDNKPSVSNPEKSSYWEELLRDRYEVHKVEEFNALGKGKRSRKQVLHFGLYDILLKSLWSHIFNDFF
jgi:chromodomain-helicase-DNA-binding protein 4